ncbi:MAG TPA: lytic transglycosylase domain-containing protein [Candidatus Sulfotelmatobacter sp.]|nr:lytic transglycosylase domain-containing protein [Candidatus Sulfotelmatobacter sp.]
MRLAFKFGVWISALLALGLALPCFAGEVAVLRNGFSIRHERREVIGDTTRLYVTADGSSFVDVPTAEIEHFEAAPDLPAPDPVSGAEAKSPPFGKLRAGFLANYARNGAPGGKSTPSPLGRIRNGPLNLDEVVNSASQRYWLDPDLVSSVIKAESGFNVRALSPKGAQGLMQLMPGTASQLGVPNAFDPEANVEGGTKYLRELLERYNFDLVKALAAYNAGPLRVEQFGGVPPYYETRAYVARVVRDFNKKKAAEEKASRQTAPSKKTNSHAATRTAHGTVTQAKGSEVQERE